MKSIQQTFQTFGIQLSHFIESKSRLLKLEYNEVNGWHFQTTVKRGKLLQKRLDKASNSQTKQLLYPPNTLHYIFKKGK